MVKQHLDWPAVGLNVWTALWGTHWDFSAIGQAVVERDAQSEVDVFGAEGAGLFDVKLVPCLLDGDFKVVMLRQLALHDVNTLLNREK